MNRKIQKFSLLELIISLGILAALAAVLLDNFADVKARECSELTQERGNHVREMVKGHRSEDGISAFLSDMGRYPSIYIPEEGDGNGGRRLAELYDPSIWYKSGTGSTALQQQKTISAATIQDICQDASGSTFPADSSGIILPYPQINMTIGWNGPYINISKAVNGNYFDGWGNAWKIISNYNLYVNNNRLAENNTSSNGIKVYATAAEVDDLRDTANNRRTRIDGIISYGANDTDDSSSTNIAASDADQKFLFAHNMDNHVNDNLARLKITLKLRACESGNWRDLPPISFWQANQSYAKGAITIANGKMYCCNISHTSGTSFATGNWVEFSSAAAYDPAIHGVGSYSGLCIYNNVYYLRNTAASESSFTPANYLRIAGTGELPDNISLFIFTPVMQGGYTTRVLELGYYHFFRNLTNENAHGVKPLYGAGGSSDIDCTGDTTTVYSASDDYNSRYLVAEDHSGANWHEYDIRRLIPGHRKIFCITYNSLTKTCYQTQVETLKLKPGNNYKTLYMERKL